MDTLQIEIFYKLLEYTVPFHFCLRTKHDFVWVKRLKKMAWVTSLRQINRYWKTMLDKNDKVWYDVANLLCLCPPDHLYAGGSYLDVCRHFVRAEEERIRAHREMVEKNYKRPRVACGIGRPRGGINAVLHPNPHNAVLHPNPHNIRIKFPTTLKQRLAHNSKNLETFLRSVDFAVVTQQEGWAESALIRYRMFLHLKRAYPDTWILPTVDIEFCWLAHIFRTEKYWKDITGLEINPNHTLCLEGYGEIVTWSEAVRSTASLWQHEFGTDYTYLEGSPDTSWKVWRTVGSGFSGYNLSRTDPHSFFPRMGPRLENAPEHVTLPSISLTKDDVQADLLWYGELNEAFRTLREKSHDVTLCGRFDMDYLLMKHLIPSYERYLNLVCTLPSKTHDVASSPGPPIVLDLVWHAHQMEPVRYKEECLSLFGRQFLHDPWPSGLGVMNESSPELECAWKTSFGTAIGDDWTFSPPEVGHLISDRQRFVTAHLNQH